MVWVEDEPEGVLAWLGRLPRLNPKAVYETKSRRNAISFAMADF
jgi:hypothetical protein